jgi:hypothetical protein
MAPIVTIATGFGLKDPLLWPGESHPAGPGASVVARDPLNRC